MKPKYKIGQKFFDPEDNAIGIIVNMQNNKYYIKWPSDALGLVITLIYSEKEIEREARHGALIPVGNANEIWKSLNEV